MITDDDIKKAFDNIARTHDGRLIYLHFQKQLCALAPPNDLGVLPQLEGRRRFAAELMGLMAEGIEQSDGRGGTDGSGRTIVFARNAAARTSQHRTAREWLAQQSDEPPER
jgi:hypothetical protein